MKSRFRFNLNSDQKGITLIEQVMAALFVGFLIMVWINSIRVTSKGTIQSKNNLRAQNIALSKLEDVKNTALQASYGRTWSSVTQSATVVAYTTPQVSTIENKKFTWVVLTNFINMPTPGLTTSPQVNSVSVTANLMIRAEVQWNDVTGPKKLTMTGYATDLRQ